MAFSCTITVNAGKMPNAQGNFVWLATAANFPLAAKDGSASSILNGGGNLRCYTDSTKATRLPLDVVSFVTGVTPVIQVWGLSPTLNVAGSVYVEADEVETTQPVSGAAFGSNAVYSDNGYSFNFEVNPTLSITNSSGGPDGVSVGMSSNNLVTGKIGNSYSFNGSTTSVDVAKSANTDWGVNNFTVSAWVNIDAGIGSNNGRIANTSGKGGSNKTGWQLKIKGNVSSWSFFDCSVSSSTGNIGAGTGFNSTFPLSVWQYVVMTYERDAKSLRLYVNGVLAESIIGGAVLGSITSPNDLIIGASKYVGNSADPIDQVFNGLIDSSVGVPTLKSDNYIAAEYNNQSDPASFWLTSAWVDGGGGLTLEVDSGAYNLTGTDISLKAAFKSAIDSGSYNLSGTATNLIVDRKAIAESGSYSLTGTNTDLIAARKSILENGIYNLTGSSVDLIYIPASGGEILIVDSGSFTLNGADVGLIVNRRTAIESGNYSLTGQSIQLTYNSKIVTDSGTYALTGQDITLFASYVTIATSGSYDLTGYSVTLKYSGDTNQTIGTVTASFADDKFTASYKPNSITVNFKD